MNQPTAQATLEAMLDELELSVDELCRLAGVNPPWVQERVALGVLSVVSAEGTHGAQGATEHWRFNAIALRRVRSMARLERDFDAVPELAALVVDLEDEIAALRAQLQRRTR